MLRSVAVLVVGLVSLGESSPVPQLNIPANSRSSTSSNNIFRSFPSTITNTGSGVQGEVSRISIVEDNSNDVLTGRDLLSVLNNRVTTSNGPAVTRTVVNGRPVTSTRNRVFTTSNAASSSSSNSDDGSNGPPMPYSFSYNVAGDDTQTYISRYNSRAAKLTQTVTFLELRRVMGPQ